MSFRRTIAQRLTQSKQNVPHFYLSVTCTLDTLLKARAVEAQSFVFAAAQTGEHANRRRTYGHSLAVAPWGEVLADAGEEPGVVLAKIDPGLVAKARGTVPSIEHDRPFSLPEEREAGE